MDIDFSPNIDPMPDDSPLRATRPLPAELEDDELRHRTQAAFDEHRRMLELGLSHLDQPRIDRLVELQHEYLRRFPDGDLSAGAADRTRSLPA